ncbi:MAG: SDR family oxidoreductase [Lentimicrobium sp.]|jgi:UDP-N-acetylglucosamine 4-epimerase|nr:SDR family oxidoreductase [Lentimicrobium sp.]MDD2527580.1 SDR family oxidoreductase [Lentimicrobiaceae bacterium]MDD4597107.1 SDR family oxidoreductase [Lentimicrobiaceae bacterium]MDY0025108.1 SDR family oxidoreductase [Lentimicrobium sp.]HAH59583.1 LPS biosynthesis protein WbpP [Bacteroidales bacterium]
MRKISGANILVTGGAGFIGSNLIEALLSQKNRVCCMDNFSTGKRENIEAFLVHPEFTLMEGDIRNGQDCRKAVAGMDFVLHEAALGSVPRSINDPVTTTEVNITGFVNMLIAARDAGIRRFVYAASSSTYGDHPALPKQEDIIGKPLSPYAITKYVNELYADVFARLFGMQTIGLRYFNVFGKRQDPDGDYAAVIPRFIKALIHHQAPVIHGDGTQSRDFTYIENVVAINQLALLVDHPEALNTVYNVAVGENTTLNQLYEHLLHHLSVLVPDIKQLKPVNGPPRTGDVKHSLASIDKARKLLGYQPAYNLDQGLAEAIPWYYEHLK